MTLKLGIIFFTTVMLLAILIGYDTARNINHDHS